MEPGEWLIVGSSPQTPPVFAVIVFLAVTVILLTFTVLLRARRDRAGRIAAERAAAQAHRMAQSTAALGQVRTSADAIEAAVQEALHWLSGDASVLFLVDEDATHLLPARSVGHQLGVSDGIALAVFGTTSPYTEAMRRLAPVVLRSAEHKQTDYAEWAAAGPWRDYSATLILPIVIDRRAAAFLQVDFVDSRDFTVDDHEYIHMLCSRTAQALSRTWSHEAVERARVDAESLRARAAAELVERQKTEQALRASETRYRALATRTTRLHALTASLSVAAGVTAVAKAIIDQAPIVVGAAGGQLHLVGDAQFEPGSCATGALDAGAPVFVGSIADAQQTYWRSAAAAADRGTSSIAALPLIANGTAIGVLEFYFNAPVNFDDEYQALLVSVAQHGTQALDRARLYEQAETARADAEAANRLKDEFVSTVSHELRTPLNAILGWSAMLRAREIESDVVPQALDAIHRNASRQARLVDDLLDFSRMASGRLTLDLEAIDAPRLIRGVVESVIPLGASSQVDVQLSDIPQVSVRGDVRRLEQVFVNLLGNALKFTPSGGHITVSGRIAGRWLEIRVADDGIGIDPEFLPHVFDRFRQGDGTPTRNHSGLGLGLSIAKQIVEAHKGSIRADSVGRGAGASFVVSLPLDGQASEHQDPANLASTPREHLAWRSGV